MKIKTLSFIFIILLLFSCKSGDKINEKIKEQQEKKLLNNSNKNKDKTKFKINYEKLESKKYFLKVLNKLGIKIYKDAKFYKIKKNKFGEGYEIIFTFNNKSKDFRDRVEKYYRYLLTQLAKEKNFKYVIVGSLQVLKKNKKVVVSINNTLDKQTNKHLLKISL